MIFEDQICSFKENTLFENNFRFIFSIFSYWNCKCLYLKYGDTGEIYQQQSHSEMKTLLHS